MQVSKAALRRSKGAQLTEQLMVEQQPPWRAFSPLANMEMMPFRDAGGFVADFNLSIQVSDPSLAYSV